MSRHFAPRRRYGWYVAILILAVAAAGGASAVVLNDPSASAISHPAGSRATTTTVPPAPLSAVPTDPAPGATGVAGAGPIVVDTTAEVTPGSVALAISPPVAGGWSASGDKLIFTPTDAFAPLTTYSVTIPAGLRATTGAVLQSAVTYRFTTEIASTLRLQQVLAQLGYLPLSWTPAPGAPPVSPGRATFSPPAGNFAWRWPNLPAPLVAGWVPDQYNTMVKGAVMAFESDHNLTVDGIAGPEVWTALDSAISAPNPAQNPHGYTYALATKALPETMTVWHDGAVITTTRVNTGIPAAPTADGTFPVYERLQTQIMRGTNPDGTKYADPVAWVAYFNGGDAVHYIARSVFGYPQSLGCIETPYAAAKQVWPYLTIGSLVTITG